jgi:hypothetical protein
MGNSKWMKRGAQLAVLLLAVLLVFGCAGSKARKQSFSSFNFSAADNPGLNKDVVGSVDWRARIVTLVVPPGTNVSRLIATYIAPEGASVYVRSQGSTIPQANGATENDFRRPVQYLLVLEDGTEVEFVVKVREAETNPDLASLTLGDNVGFSPGFSTNVESYSAEVPYAIERLTIRPNAESVYASITIDGRTYPARNATAAVPLRAGEVNAIAIVVTAEDGVSTRTYTLNVKRAEPDRDSGLAALTVSGDTVLTPSFSPDVTGYRISVPYQPEDLTTTTYTVTIQRAEPDRDSTLAAIGVNEGTSVAPKFSKGITAYEVSIPNTMDTVVLTPQASSPVATVSVAGKAVPPGSSLEPIVLPEDSSTELEITVTAQDSKTTTSYALKVTRRPIDATWTQAAGSAGFSGRYGFESVVFKGRLWIIGGSSTSFDYFNDIWYSQDGVSWTRATENGGFRPRRNHQVVEYKGQLWLIGGETGMAEYSNDVWTSKDGVYWTQVAVTEPFPALVNHQVTVFKGQMWIVGGHGSGSTGRSVWSSKDGKVWTEETHEAAFPDRDGHQLVTFQNKMWIIGGRQSGSELLADVWSSTDGVNWTQVADLSVSGFEPRMLHEAAVYAGRMWVSGGYVDGKGAVNDVWYTKNGAEWKLATESAEFVGRIGHQMVNFKGKLWILGGTDNQVARNDIWYSNAKEEEAATE